MLTEYKIDQLRRFVDIQGMDGNWNYNSYMCGMYNGMEFMLAMVEDREPVYRELPKKKRKKKVDVVIHDGSTESDQ